MTIGEFYILDQAMGPGDYISEFYILDQAMGPDDYRRVLYTRSSYGAR